LEHFFLIHSPDVTIIPIRKRHIAASKPIDVEDKCDVLREDFFPGAFGIWPTVVAIRASVVATVCPGVLKLTSVVELTSGVTFVVTSVVELTFVDSIEVEQSDVH
jgi:hypothetical protein